MKEPYRTGILVTMLWGRARKVVAVFICSVVNTP